MTSAVKAPRTGPRRTVGRAQAALILLAVEAYGRATAAQTRAIMSLPVDDTKIIAARQDVVKALTTVMERLADVTVEE